MSDTYQAIYDAACRKIQGGNVSDAIESALRDAFGSAQSLMASVAQHYSAVAEEMARPSAVYRPAISIDGDQWGVLYGNNLQEGVAGFGASPAEAMADFDKNWLAKLKTDGTKVCADALLAECGEDKPTNEHQNYSALPKNPYARPYVSGSATTQPRKSEVTDEMINWKPASEHPDVLNASTCEEAVEIAVRMTERQIAENVLNSNLPPTEEVTNEP